MELKGNRTKTSKTADFFCEDYWDVLLVLGTCMKHLYFSRLDTSGK